MCFRSGIVMQSGTRASLGSSDLRLIDEFSPFIFQAHGYMCIFRFTSGASLKRFDDLFSRV
jgi:hypothetical protein